MKTNALDLRESIRQLVEGRIRCECGNSNWENFLYVGNLPDGGIAGCKLCAKTIVLDDIIKANWKPSNSDLAWTRALISVWNEGAIWKTSFATFRTSVANKTLAVIQIHRHDIIERELAKVRHTFESLGWVVYLDTSIRPDQNGSDQNGRSDGRSECDHCGERATLHKVKYADDMGVGSMMICDKCEDDPERGEQIKW